MECNEGNLQSQQSSARSGSRRERPAGVCVKSGFCWGWDRNGKYLIGPTKRTAGSHGVGAEAKLCVLDSF